jgi:[acyl-carrier-protein] S-malonyltransferase
MTTFRPLGLVLLVLAPGLVAQAPAPAQSQSPATSVDRQVQEMRRQVTMGQLVRSHVRVTVRLKNGNKLKGVVKDGFLVERVDGLRFVAAEKDEAGAGIRLFYYNGTNNYVFLPFRDVKEYSVNQRLSSAELQLIESQLRRQQEQEALQREREQAAPATGDPGQPTEDPAPSGPVTGQVPENDGGLSPEQKELFALLREFPPLEGWNQVRRDEISRRMSVVGANPTPTEKKFIERFADWQRAARCSASRRSRSRRRPNRKTAASRAQVAAGRRAPPAPSGGGLDRCPPRGEACAMQRPSCSPVRVRSSPAWARTWPSGSRRRERSLPPTGTRRAAEPALLGGPEADLALTTNTQPATLTVAIAAFRALGQRPDLAAGHSLGEYAALVAGGALDFADAVRLVRERARRMQDAVPVGTGGMVALRKLLIDDVRALMEQVDQGVCEIANINEPEQIVVSGHVAAMDAIVALAPLRKALRLNVSVPFHCSLLRPAGEQFARGVLASVRLTDPAFPIWSNVDARPNTTAAAVRDALARQFAGTVLWQQTIEGMFAAGVRQFVECGPKPTLVNIFKRIALARGVDGVETMAATTADEVARWPHCDRAEPLRQRYGARSAGLVAGVPAGPSPAGCRRTFAGR